MTIIGLQQDHPKMCGDEHFPGCFNPELDETTNGGEVSRLGGAPTSPSPGSES